MSQLTTGSSVSPITVSSNVGFRSAFEGAEGARAALRAADLVPINLDIPTTIVAVLNASPRIHALRDALATLPSIDLEAIDALESYADALSYAHTAYLAASEPMPELPALLERAMLVREQLVSDATALAHRGLLDSKQLTDVKGGAGYLAVAYDVGVLVSMLRGRWAEIASKSAIQASELDEAEALYERVLRGYAERTRQSAVVAKAADNRARAYTLLVNAYDQARRAVIFIRWDEGDADKVAPSLWAGRGGRGKVAPANTPSDDEEPVETQPGLGPMPIATPPATPGLPGGSPFA